MMDAHQCWRLPISIFFSLLLQAAAALTANNLLSIDSTELLIKNKSSKILAEGRTGTTYIVPVQENLPGMSCSVVRLRSKAFWVRGANLGPFVIPPSTLPMPYKRRIALVSQNWGNWSNSYFNISQGYKLAAPVTSLLAYDASNTDASLTNAFQLDLTMYDGPIYINFSKALSDNGSASGITCVTFGPDGTMSFQGYYTDDSCAINGTGHFTIAAPSTVPGPGPHAVEAEKRAKVTKISAVGSVVVLILLVMVGLVAIKFARLREKRRMNEMERKREEGEVLMHVTVGDCRLPCAIVCRTKPILEDENPAKL